MPIANLNSPLLHVCTNALVLDASLLELCVLGKSKLTFEAVGDDSSFNLLEKSLFELSFEKGFSESEAESRVMFLN